MTGLAEPLPWDAQQREWLQALGHDVLGLASSAGVDTADAAEPEPERALAEPVQRHRQTRELDVPKLIALRRLQAIEHTLSGELAL